MNPNEQIKNLKQQGKSEQEIAKTLRQQGMSPKQITDSLSQAQVKSDVMNMQNQGMQPSIMPQGEEQIPEPEEPEPPKPEDYEPQQKTKLKREYYMPPQESFQDFQTQQFPQEYGQDYEQDLYQPQEAYEAGGYDTDTMIDIAEQVFTEKLTEINKQLENITEVKTLSQAKIEHLEKRLEKIESIIDKLQIAILQKISSYGDNLQSIKNEMSMMQDSFSKMINPLASKASQIQKPAPIRKVVKKPITRKTKKLTKKKII